MEVEQYGNRAIRPHGNTAIERFEAKLTIELRVVQVHDVGWYLTGHPMEVTE
jgi:hypothetical protein